MDSLKNLLVIIGPKDAGKSTETVTLKPYWRELEQIVVELNMKKGTSRAVTGKHAAMLRISKQLIDQLVLFDIKSS